MKRISLTAIVVILIVLCMFLFAWAAEDKGGFSGTWILDQKKGDRNPRMVMRPMPGGDMGGGMSGGMGGGMSGGMGGGMSGGMGGGMSGGMGGGMSGGMGGGMPGDMGGGMPGGDMGGATTDRGKATQPQAEPAPLIVKQNGDELQISTTLNMLGKMTPVVESYKCDGNEKTEMIKFPNVPEPVKQTTKATLKKTKLTITRVAFIPNSPMEFERELSLSKDGNTLKVKTVSSNQFMQFIQEQYYNRQ